MDLARWEPFRDLLTLQDSMNRIINQPYLCLSAPLEAVGGWFPPVDVHEEAERIVFRAELPGVDRDDIDVSVENGTLTLRGEKKQQKDVIHASYRDGVLEVVLPKA